MMRMRIPVLLSLIVIAIAGVAQAAIGQTRDERAIRAGSDAWQRYIVQINGRGPFVINPGAPK